MVQETLTDANGSGDSDAVWSFGYNRAKQVKTKSLPRVFQWTPVTGANDDYVANGLNQYASIGGAALTYDGITVTVH